jgi:sortase A
VTRTRLLHIVGAVGELALTAGVLLLLFVAWLVFWTGPRGATDAARTVAALQRQWDAKPPVSPTTIRVGSAVPAGEFPSLPDPVAGEPFAVLQVPRFGADWRFPVLEGVDRDVLREGVGHYPGTALPGDVGNLALAGHRTTWGQPFHDIERLRPGDEVRVQTRWARFTYRVTGHHVVRPDRGDLLAPVPGRPQAVPQQARLTLTTCHPEYSAKNRWVVDAVLVSALPE